MKKLYNLLNIIVIAIAALGMTLALSSCDKDVFKSDTITALYPNAKIYQCTEVPQYFLVEKDGNITWFYMDAGRANVKYAFVLVHTP